MTGPLLITGGGGRLGHELRVLLPDALAPGRTELDVTDASSTVNGYRLWWWWCVCGASSRRDGLRTVEFALRLGLFGWGGQLSTACC